MDSRHPLSAALNYNQRSYGCPIKLQTIHLSNTITRIFIRLCNSAIDYCLITGSRCAVCRGEYFSFMLLHIIRVNNCACCHYWSNPSIFVRSCATLLYMNVVIMLYITNEQPKSKTICFAYFTRFKDVQFPAYFHSGLFSCYNQYVTYIKTHSQMISNRFVNSHNWYHPYFDISIGGGAKIGFNNTTRFQDR